jgi:membrane-associated phospholipid phosphatase
LGLHFPLDILAGFAFGSCSGFAFYKWYVWAKNKFSF